jgi:hypothetical protein
MEREKESEGKGVGENGKKERKEGALGYLFGGQAWAKVEIVIKALGSFLAEAELFEVENCDLQILKVEDICGRISCSGL